MLKTIVSGSSRRLSGMLNIISLTLVCLTPFAPNKAEAMSAFLYSITANYPGSNLSALCGNCHMDFGGSDLGNALGMDYWIWEGGSGSIPSASSGFSINDADMDGRSTDYELFYSTDPSPSPRLWIPSHADKDGDGCIQLINRANDFGVPAAPININGSFVGASKGFLTYGPRGWDSDDNDAAQGCNADAATIGWPVAGNTPGAGFTNPGATTDTTPPAQITNLRANGLAASALPLVWAATGDDGMTGTAHSYDLRYTTSPLASAKLLCSTAGSSAAGLSPCLVRDRAHWQRMYDITDSRSQIAGWNAGMTAPLMRAFYEPLPTAAGTVQACNALGQEAACALSTGASYVLKTQGAAYPTNIVTDGTTYWAAIRATDGVIRLSSGGTLSAPGTVSENNAMVSNIVAITAGTAGAAITSYGPATIQSSNSTVITAQGYGLTATNSAQLVLTDATGTVVASASLVTQATTSVSGTFSGPIPAGVYTLEARSSTGMTKAAWVDAIFVISSSGTIITLPTGRGQCAQNQDIAITGTNFSSAVIADFGPGITVNSATANSSTSVTANISVSCTAQAGSRNIYVTNTDGSAGATSFTITAAPAITTCSPPSGGASVAYSYTCAASGGMPPLLWSATGLPPGLAIDGSTGVISGVPYQEGTFSGGVTATDVNAGSASAATSIIIQPNVDLIITSINAASLNPALGQTSTVFVGIDNVSLSFARDVGMGVYLSKDAIITTSDILIGSTSVIRVPPARVEAVTVAIPKTTPIGTYYIGAIADPANVQPENNAAGTAETNNALTGSIIKVVRKAR